MKAKKLSGAKLTNALDSTVRDILHARYPNPTCFVCGKNKGWFHPKKNPKGCQVGHYVSRRVYQLRWDLQNLECQCAPCNYTHQFNTLPYTNRIIEVYGSERITRLNALYITCKTKKMSTIEKRKKLELLEDLLKSLS